MSTKLDMSDSWTVRLDVDAPYPNTPGRTYKKHVTLLVLAPTLERAIVVAREQYPDSAIWAVNHSQKSAVVLVDSAVPETLSSGAAKGGE